MVHQEEDQHASEKHKAEELNDKVGFKCLHYAVTESVGKAKITVIKKCKESLTVGVRTRDDTAREPEDYKKIDETLIFSANENERIVEIQISDDDEWEPDEDFFVELYDLKSGKILNGVDASTKVTIIDDDEPGMMGFKDK
jgi:solute carrier family 8 (sodium/calcium exchanger)